MKKIITPAVREEAETLCDVTGKPAVARLVLAFDYYGGVHDEKVMKVDLSEEAAADLLALLQKKYPQITTQEHGTPIACPWCGRGT
jgi:hypothetical protein